MTGNPRGPLNSTLYNTIVVVVLAVWVVNFVARFLVPGYQPAPQIDAIFMAIAGGAMALNRMSGNPPDPPPPPLPPPAQGEDVARTPGGE